ncbi:MAG: hypothetical protein IJG43_10905, partial [Acidaminococcaceae bacterium]|nr:hypothetical protein [Acidaminococcaceae bacterium]
SMEVASLLAPKVIYLATCLLTGSNFEIIGNTDIRSEALSQADLKTMKNFKKIRTDGYGYLILADKLLSEYRNNQ